MESTDFISSMSIFDPRHLPSSERELSNYGMNKLRVLTSFYGTSQKVIFDGKEVVSQPDVDVDVEETVSEWKLFRRIFLKEYKDSSLQQVFLTLTGNEDIVAGFPNLSKLAAILEILPVTTAIVERTFSSMKLIKQDKTEK